jgi:hypothetical protein
MARAIQRRANWFAGVVVWVFAAFVFPMHLGLAGAPALALAAYTALAAGLLLTADILHDPGAYRGRGLVRAQVSPFFIAVAVPAMLGFAIGKVLAPLDQAVEDEQVCALAGFAPAAEGAMADLGDGLDPTADCAPAPAV